MAKFYMTYKESEKIECKLMQNEINNGNRHGVIPIVRNGKKRAISYEQIIGMINCYLNISPSVDFSFKRQFRDDEVPRAPARDVLSNILYSLTRENEHDAEWIALQRKLSSNSFVVKLARV